MGGPKLTPKQVERIKRDLIAGVSRNELMYRLDVKRSTIAGIASGRTWVNICPELNKDLRTLKQREWQKVADLKAQGLSYIEIGERTGKCVQTISKILSRFNGKTLVGARYRETNLALRKRVAYLEAELELRDFELAKLKEKEEIYAFT